MDRKSMSNGGLTLVLAGFPPTSLPICHGVNPTELMTKDTGWREPALLGRERREIRIYYSGS